MVNDDGVHGCACTHQARISSSSRQLSCWSNILCPTLSLSEQGAEVVECACMIELKALNGVGKLHETHPDVPVWSLISEDILTVKGAQDS